VSVNLCIYQRSGYKNNNLEWHINQINNTLSDFIYPLKNKFIAKADDSYQDYTLHYDSIKTLKVKRKSIEQHRVSKKLYSRIITD
jgi:hypothetical protein